MDYYILGSFCLVNNIDLLFKINSKIFYFYCYLSETTNKVGGHLSLSHLGLIVELVEVKAFMDD